MESDEGLLGPLAEKLADKADLQQSVTDNTLVVFNHLKELLHEFSTELDETLEEKLNKRVRIEYRDRGKFEAQIQVAADMLIFTMHTNAFTFPEGHPVWNNPYVSADRANAYCGVINVYNFLSDSFKHNRSADEGYLIGRVYINRNMHYFVEGSRQRGVHCEAFGGSEINRAALLAIVAGAVEYALDFDMFVPPFDVVKTVSVDQLNTKFEGTKLETGKRLGYSFTIDDI